MTPPIEMMQDAEQKKKEGIKGEPREVKKKDQNSGKTPAATGNAPKPDTRAEEVFSGIPGSSAGVTKIERNVPADEPPALAPNEQLKHVGKRVPRQDGRFKVTGAAKYPSDIALPGMLYAKFVSATPAHARITSVDTAAAEKHPGVKAVHVIEHVLLSAEVLDKSKELPSKYPVIRYSGQPIAAVAATSPQAAAEAAALVKVQYEELPFVLTADQARQPNAAQVFPAPAAQAESAGGGGGGENVPQQGNVRGPEKGRGDKGDVEQGFAISAAVVEGKYNTQVQTHSALETHGVVADWKPDSLTVYASTQSTLSVRDELAAIFKLPKTKVRVVTEYMGGGFGAKFGAGNVGAVAAQLSKQTGAPVKLFCDRREEHWTGGNRPDSQATIKIGAAKDGKLQAIEYTNYGTAGVGTGAGTAGPAQNMYECPNVKTAEYDVFTNASPGAAFRAPGHPQGCFGLEQAMDELAEKLGIDPVELRDRNDKSEARRQERLIGSEKFGWKQKFRKANSDPGPIQHGVGFAQSVWYRIVNMDSGCEVRIHRDGSVEALSAVQDIGGGIKTVIAQVVAEELGIEPRQVQVTIGDTNSPPGPPSGGSMTTGSITPAVRNAAYKAKQELLEQTKSALRGQDPNALSLKQLAAKLPTEMVTATARRSPEYGKRERMFLGGVQFADVSVDTETGIIKVNHIVAVHDCGRPMNLLQLESQVNGGILQGISYALYENRRLDRNTGIMVNPNMEQYKIVGSYETPKIEAYFIEDYIARSSTDAGGIGEPATIPTSAAIANAFYNATGVRLRDLPMNPPRVLAALGKLQGGNA
jgi:xanthine dehydrogenase YagR molybdenum-binding subunit